MPGMFKRAAITGLALGVTTQVLASVAASAATDTAMLPTQPLGGVLNGTLEAGHLSVSWERNELHSLYAVVDEHTQKIQQIGSRAAYHEQVDTSDSAALLILGVRPDETVDVLGKVVASVPTRSSSVPAIVAVADSSGVALDWTEVPHVTSWQIGAGGQIVSTIAATSTELPIALSDIADSGETRLTVTGERTIDGVTTRIVNGIDVTLSTLDTASVNSSSSEDEVVAGTVPSVKATRLKYETYIPDKYIPAPDNWAIPDDCESGDGSDYWYGGDDRGKAFNSSRFRTLGVNQYTWGVARITSKSVSKTTRYIQRDDGTMVYEGSRQASDSGMAVSSTSMDATTARGGIVHNIGNPYCDAMNSITYRTQHTVYRSGGYQVQGSHDKMPNHHLYRTTIYSDGTRSHLTVFHHPLKSPFCLHDFVVASGACPQWEYSYTR